MIQRHHRDQHVDQDVGERVFLLGLGIGHGGLAGR